jgi:large subunit ribosomal protein L2
MPIKSFSPTTPTRRFQTYLTREDITKDRPEKSLVEGKKRTGGRDARGRISSRFRSGGAKKENRLIDFKRDKVRLEDKESSNE